MTPQELAEFVTGRVGHNTHVGGMMLWGSIGSAAYLLPDGTVVFEEAVDWAGGSKEYRLRPATVQEAAGSFKAALARYPELSYLVPVRRPTSECTKCAGSGVFVRADGTRFEGVWCEPCSGLGYLVG